MVTVAQLAEHWIVAPVVVGSSPIGHPIFLPSSNPSLLHLKFVRCGSALLPMELLKKADSAATSPKNISPTRFEPKVGRWIFCFMAAHTKARNERGALLLTVFPFTLHSC